MFFNGIGFLLMSVFFIVGCCFLSEFLFWGGWEALLVTLTVKVGASTRLSFVLISLEGAYFEGNI